MNQSSDHDVTALPGDCLTEVPVEQKEREAEGAASEGERFFEGVPVPNDQELV